MTEAHSYWRPRFNYQPHDRDGDGQLDEDPCEDLDGDGEISLMYVPDPKGKYVLKDGKLVNSGTVDVMEASLRFSLLRLLAGTF